MGLRQVTLFLRETRPSSLAHGIVVEGQQVNVGESPVLPPKCVFRFPGQIRVSLAEVMHYKPSGYLYLDGQEEREMEWWDEMEAEGGT